jgi:hypothetical protein
MGSLERFSDFRLDQVKTGEIPLHWGRVLNNTEGLGDFFEPPSVLKSVVLRDTVSSPFCLEEK